MSSAPTSSLLDALRRCRLLEAAQLEELPSLLLCFPQPRALAGELIRRGWLTPYQANLLLQGRGQELLLGSYVVLERLGEGGMGQVFKARNWKLGKVVAVKVIRSDRLGNPEAVQRFEREVRAAALSHPNIIHSLDADCIGSTHLLVMEYAEGIDLGRLVKERGPLPVAQACDFIRQAALGLQHACEQGLVHRDIKPSNLLVCRPGGTVKLLDLGLARVAASGEASLTMTREGVVMGTPDFMAPEQTLDAHTVDIRADLYSLGCTLYYLLTATVPFPGGSLGQKMARHQVQEPVPVEQRRPEVPAAVAALVRKLMAKKPEDRYQTPGELAAALAGLALHVPPAAGDSRTVAEDGRAAVTPAAEDTLHQALDFRPTEEEMRRLQGEEGRRHRRERRLLLLGLLGGGVVLLGLAGGFLALLRRPEPPSSPAVTADPDEWVRRVAALPPDQQVQAVAEELRKRNPDFNSKLSHEAEGGVVTVLQVHVDAVTDLSPLRALTGLRVLHCLSTPEKRRLTDLKPLRGLKLTELHFDFAPVADLRPLKDMPLTRLSFAGTKVHDLRPLQGLPLTSLICFHTEVADLKPLQGMKLTFLNCDGTKVSDLSPLEGMPLTALYCSGTKVSDLSPLKNLKLQELRCAGTPVSDLSPLKGMPLTGLNCINTAVSDLSSLKDLPLIELHCGDTKVTDLSPLRGLKLTQLSCFRMAVSDLSPLAGMKLTFLSCFQTPVADLSPLKGMELKELNCEATEISDLSPLKGMPLTALYAGGTKVANLSPLAGMKLTSLRVQGTPVADLSPLRGMPLTELVCDQARVTDLAPLKGMPLKELRCDFKPERDAEILRSLTLLETINGKPAKVFWQEVEAGPGAKP